MGVGRGVEGNGQVYASLYSSAIHCSSQCMVIAFYISDVKITKCVYKIRFMVFPFHLLQLLCDSN